MADALDKRLDVLTRCGFVDESERESLKAVGDLLVRECGVAREDEVLGTLITHIAAAIKRVHDEEKLSPLSDEIVSEVKQSSVYPEAHRLQQEIQSLMPLELPDEEKDFVLVHVGGLLTSQTTNRRG